MADIEGINGQRENFRVVGKPNTPGRLSHAIAAGIERSRQKTGVEVEGDECAILIIE